MAKKKSFSIQGSLTQALSDTVAAANNYSGDLLVEVIPLRKIELDPDNPRDLSITPSDLLDGLLKSDPLYDRKKNEIQLLETLSHSIKEQGIINPIIVYKHITNYRLIAGERRTLASILAGKTDIQAKIIDGKPSALKLGLLQWIENIEREDLSLWERIRNLEKIAEAYAVEHQTNVSQVTATTLSQLLGCSIQQAALYKNVMDASEEIRKSIRNNEIKNLEKATLIIKAPKEIQKALIEACIKGATPKELKILLEQHLDQKKRAGHKKTDSIKQIYFGNTTNSNVARTIIDCVISSAKFDHIKDQFMSIDWENHTAVTNAFKNLIRLIEKTA